MILWNVVMGWNDAACDAVVRADRKSKYTSQKHDDVIKWKHFPCYWLFVRGIHRSPVNSPQRGQWPGVLMVCICTWINDWINNRDAGDLRRHRSHNDVTLMNYGRMKLHFVCIVWNFQTLFPVWIWWILILISLKFIEMDLIARQNWQ